MILPDEVIESCVVNWIAAGDLVRREMLATVSDEFLACDVGRGLEDNVRLLELAFCLSAVPPTAASATGGWHRTRSISAG